MAAASKRAGGSASGNCRREKAGSEKGRKIEPRTPGNWESESKGNRGHKCDKIAELELRGWSTPSSRGSLHRAHTDSRDYRRPRDTALYSSTGTG
ncbi:Hypothetical predicted protein [Pelobates cultripes]|uniref:Uncharacterized protein n=1 Tax=Pelobates cultripes TaxID=61616 RepID=A0AAD1SAZ9_PELCU|nr:Hypothetical predicted protein [Pelobates cultripes]